jgi:hypothetical protein
MAWHDRRMVLLVELLLAAGVLFGVYRLATRPEDGMAVAEPDRSPGERVDGALTADELVAMHIPMGVGYRKVDVDRLLDRLARQLPRAVYESATAESDRNEAPVEPPGEQPHQTDQTDPRLTSTETPTPEKESNDG